MIFKIIKRDTHEIFFFLSYFEKNRLYDSGLSLCIFVRMRIAGWRYYELMVGTDEILATKHDTVNGQRQVEIATLVLHIFFVIYYD